ncbi:hypothetical protein B7463_g2057, partial [Scytalidium lignicola]
MSVKDISARALDFQWEEDVPLKNWLRSADTMLSQAQIYDHEENYQQAYLLLMRYAALVTEYIPRHPSVRAPETREALRNAIKNVPAVVARLEAIKPKIEARHEAWKKMIEIRKHIGATTSPSRSQSRSHIDFATSDPAVAGKSTTLAADEHGDLAVQLARSEIRRRDTARRATRMAGVSPQEEQKRRIAGLWDTWDYGTAGDREPVEGDDLRWKMEEARRRMETPYDIRRDSPRTGFRKSMQTPPPVDALRNSNGTPSTLRPGLQPSLIPPPKPPKEDNRREQFEDDNRPPALPEKTALVPDTTTETVTHKPSDYTFRPSAYLESGEPLRPVFLPPRLRNEFLKYAEPNTRRNLETCGMLCGTLISNALFISKVVIPEQESTSDTCDTVNENALFEYCSSEDLMVLGWIHTHPTQTCFMSSRDLHTQSGYQTMIPESIAIVCAPSQTPSWGVFRLTDPPGKQTILKCHKTGLFHPHDAVNIYTDALKPGHVVEAEGLDFEVVDLRP